MVRRNQATCPSSAAAVVALSLIVAGCAIAPHSVDSDFGVDATQQWVEPRTNRVAPAQGEQRAPPQPVKATPPDELFHPATGPFVGASYVWATVGNDFDGRTRFVSDDGSEVANVPSVDPGSGVRIATGWRWSRAAVELAYQQTAHDGEFAGVSGFDVTYSSVEVDGRFYLPSFTERLKPSVLVGLVVPWLDVKNGVRNVNGPGSGTATYSGYGFDFGLGADFYVTSHWSIDLLAVYRFADFTHLSGMRTSGTLPNDLNGSGPILGVGTSWTF